MFKKILRSWVFWIAVLIALLGAASFWFPYLGIPIAALTVVSAVLQGYENQRTQEDIQTKHTQAITQIQISRDDAIKHIEQVRKEERFITKWATRLLVGIVWTFHWFGYEVGLPYLVDGSAAEH